MKITVQTYSGDGQAQLLKTNCIIELNSKFKSKKLTYSFKHDKKIHDHFAAPTLQKVIEYRFELQGNL